MKNVGLTRKIIAVDFDGTLCEDEFPKIGRAIQETIDRFNREKLRGSRMILHTCRAGDNLQEALDWCSEKGLEFDAVNKNLQENIDIYGIDTRKVFAHEYWDDRNVLLPNLKHPDKREESDMDTWAKREIDIALETEKNYMMSNVDLEYAKACYESAYKAYENLMYDGHTGYSIGIIKSILVRLIAGIPLTPIEDSDDIWNFVYEEEGVKTYQCSRMSSLFKDVEFVDGEELITYRDIDRVVGVDLVMDNYYHSGLISRIVDDLYPIKMPYTPLDKSYKVYTREFLTDIKNGDFDTKAVLYVVTPETHSAKSETVDIYKYYMEGENGEWVEITKDTYEARKHMARRLKMEGERF